MRVTCYILGTMFIATVVVYQLLTGWIPARSGKKVLFPSHTHNIKNSLTWAVKILNKSDMKDHVNRIASDLGLINEGQVGHLDNVYIFHYDIKHINTNKSVSDSNIYKTKISEDNSSGRNHEEVVINKHIKDDINAKSPVKDNTKSGNPLIDEKRNPEIVKTNTKNQLTDNIRNPEVDKTDTRKPIEDKKNMSNSIKSELHDRNPKSDMKYQRKDEKNARNPSKDKNIKSIQEDIDSDARNAAKPKAVTRNVVEFHQNLFTVGEMERIIAEVEQKLENHNDVEWHSHQKIVARSPRSLQFEDPYYSKQWHLHNFYEHGMDVNVTGVWDHGITGKCVTVAVVDDGLEWNNPDLKDNYNAAGSWDFNGNDDDPMPDASKTTNHHGTRCAGEIAAVPNDVCGVGVAFGAKVSGVKILDGPMTDSMEGSAFTKNFQINDVYSCSWGPDDDGRTVDGPHVLAAAAMKYGIDFGRHGYGNIYIVASGNGGQVGDNCNYDGYANSIYTVTIGAVDETGHMPYYSEECASMLAVTFSSGAGWGIRDIVTTDWMAHATHGIKGCTEHHTGTSAAAPIAAGLVALMLEVQPCLSWRDVQYLIILTAQKVDIDEAHWQKNGAGLWHSHKHGFGLMKAWRLVNAAKIWNRVPWLTSFSYERDDIDLYLPKGRDNPFTITYTVTEDMTNGYDLYILETVQVTLSINTEGRGKLEIKLISPHGTVSVIGASRPNDDSVLGYDKWTFSTVRCWGETPVGKWTVVITDHDNPRDPDFEEANLYYFMLKFYGTLLTPKQLQDRRREIEAAMHGDFLRSNTSTVCLPPPVSAIPAPPLSQKTLKIIALSCAFLFIMAVYESLEYLLCYNDEKAESSKIRKLVTRAHRLARNAMRPELISQNSISESTGLLTEEIPMQTLSTEGQISRSNDSRSEMPTNSRLYPSGVNDSHFGASVESSHIEPRNNSQIEAETSLDTALTVQSGSNNPVSKSRSSNIFNKIKSAIFSKKNKTTRYVPLETCDSSDSEETVIFKPDQEILMCENELQEPINPDSSVSGQASVETDHVVKSQSS